MSAGTWLILGGSSTIGRAFAREVAAAGYAVILAGRDRDDLAQSAADLALRFGVDAQAMDFDAVDIAGHRSFVEAVAAHAPAPLHVFLAFAQMAPQADLEREPEQAAAVIDATFGGAASVLGHLALVLERQGQGHVVVLGSVAGDRGRRSNYVYGSAKAGLAAYVSGLRARLRQHGVKVTLIKPGFVDTAMTWHLAGLRGVADPADVAAACLRHGLRGKAVAYVPGRWRLIMLVIIHIPEAIFVRLPL